MLGRIDSATLSVVGLPLLDDAGPEEGGDALAVPGAAHGDDNVPEAAAGLVLEAAVGRGDLRLMRGSSCRSGHALPWGQ
jgi:hypothetical protein